tara:strand:+ start:152 stop:922 length:771 start_codon:yes stop_codon:yes gene_type:complete
MPTKSNKTKYPSEVIDLPSEGKLYSKDSPLASGNIDIKFMTAKEEDILTSQNLIKKGVVMDKLLDSLILTEGVTSNDLILGDKNAIMVASRILAYGPEYTAEITDPSTDEKLSHTFNLSECDYKKLPDDISYDGNNEFEVELPVSKDKLKFKLLTGHDEKKISSIIAANKKMRSNVSPEITARLKTAIISINGDDSMGVINSYVDNMLSRDSLFLRQEIQRITPDIELSQTIDLGGEMVQVDIPLTIEFFWPNIKT